MVAEVQRCARGDGLGAFAGRNPIGADNPPWRAVVLACIRIPDSGGPLGETGPETPANRRTRTGGRCTPVPSPVSECGSNDRTRSDVLNDASVVVRRDRGCAGGGSGTERDATAQQCHHGGDPNNVLPHLPTVPTSTCCCRVSRRSNPRQRRNVRATTDLVQTIRLRHDRSRAGTTSIWAAWSGCPCLRGGRVRSAGRHTQGIWSARRRRYGGVRQRPTRARPSWS